MNTKFYKYMQNNAGGIIVEDDYVAYLVYIEAHSHMEANSIAQKIGIYFNGVENNLDCQCCGDRWLQIKSESEFTSFNNLQQIARDVDINLQYSSQTAQGLFRIHLLSGIVIQNSNEIKILLSNPTISKQQFYSRMFRQ